MSGDGHNLTNKVDKISNGLTPDYRDALPKITPLPVKPSAPDHLKVTPTTNEPLDKPSPKPDHLKLDFLDDETLEEIGTDLEDLYQTFRGCSVDPSANKDNKAAPITKSNTDAPKKPYNKGPKL